ncbi:hypothetical protein Ddc_09352 [Ditylenchus destructor]|nr:hypothetical protein Ddc_09352 [Ditylenchus destructor]
MNLNLQKGTSKHYASILFADDVISISIALQFNNTETDAMEQSTSSTGDELSSKSYTDGSDEDSEDVSSDEDEGVDYLHYLQYPKSYFLLERNCQYLTTLNDLI